MGSNAGRAGRHRPRVPIRLEARIHTKRSQGPGGPARSQHTRVRSACMPHARHLATQPAAAECRPRLRVAEPPDHRVWNRGHPRPIPRSAFSRTLPPPRTQPRGACHDRAGGRRCSSQNETPGVAEHTTTTPAANQAGKCRRAPPHVKIYPPLGFHTPSPTSSRAAKPFLLKTLNFI